MTSDHDAKLPSSEGDGLTRSFPLATLPICSGVAPSKWCITKEDLDVFEREVRELWLAGQIPEHPDHPSKLHNDPRIGPNIHQVNESYIKPRTSAGVSWALMRHPAGLECDVFATHCWTEGVFEFTEKVKRMWPRDARHLYVCFLSNPQNGDVKGMLGNDPLQSPFALALRSARYLLVIPNRQCSIYTRMWCVLEAYLALRLGLKIRLLSTPRARDALFTLCPGLLCFAAGILISAWLWVSLHVAPDILALSPLQYILICYGHRFSRVLKIMCVWLNMFVVGCYIGAAFFPLFTEGLVASCSSFLILCIAVCCDMVKHTIQLLIAEAVAMERNKLDFETVGNAKCSDSSDSERILNVISGHEDDIDGAIMAIRTVGRYDAALRANLKRGMSLRRAGAGVLVGPAAMVACKLACQSWRFAMPGENVLDTDARSCSVVCVAMLLAFATALWAGDSAIFMVDSVFCSCSAALAASLLPILIPASENRAIPSIHSFVHLDRILQDFADPRVSCLLGGICMFYVIVANILFYTCLLDGFQNWWKRRLHAIWRRLSKVRVCVKTTSPSVKDCIHSTCSA